MSDVVIVCLDGAVSETWRQCADVLYGSRTRPSGDARVLAERTLRRYPGCALVVVPGPDGACTALTRARVTLQLPDESGELTALEVARVLHASMMRESAP
ncbi:hypothetical protein G5C60_29775 [Streptomyces sp. HC44]|uniref:Uncharacterized protein n=1 Tax=Streptomyces scabichelini TaxID=2711217 RepID=A0A6G4VC20_9ACTN|nr:hypothetical protein [Streptomyces scabichelini]NGO11672.1 hypothetical protein [Streptomyces scabichelini]